MAAGLQPTLVTWNTLLASIGATGNWGEALDVLSQVACFGLCTHACRDVVLTSAMV